MENRERYREKYLKLLHQKLRENVKRTSDLNLDDLMLTHFAMKIEEDCHEKNRDSAAYIRALTMSRLSIERCTCEKKLFPMIAEAMQLFDDNKEKNIEQNQKQGRN